MADLPPCPICQKSAQFKYKPFCSARCADIDLGRWLKEGYAIPASERVPEPITQDEE